MFPGFRGLRSHAHIVRLVDRGGAQRRRPDAGRRRPRRPRRKAGAAGRTGAPARRWPDARSSRNPRSRSTSRASTLKTAEHPVPKAKFPVIDIHSHQPAPMSDEQFDRGRRRHGRAQPAGAGERQRRARAIAWCESVQALKASPLPGPHGAVHRRRLPQRRPGLGRARPWRSSRPTSRPARSASARSRKAFGLRIRKADGTRLQDRRPGARSGLGGGGAPQHPGVHPHRRAAGVLRADRLPERALARAGALSAIAATRPASSRASRS